MQLSGEQVDIWLVDQRTSLSNQELQQCHDWLSPEEWHRAQRFVFTRDRERFIQAKVLQRAVLSRYYPAIPPHQWVFDFNQHGKPHIANTTSEALYFNLSHTDGMIALAVTRIGEIGIDVESVNRNNDLRSLADYCFTEIEQDYLYKDDEQEFERRFFTLWTLKEAVVKAVGVGISLGLKRFEFQVKGESTSVSPLPSPHPQQWFLHKTQLSEHTLALAVATELSPQVQVYRGHSLGEQYRQADAAPLTQSRNTAPKSS